MRAAARSSASFPEGMVERELAYSDLPDLRIVASMHERKALMAELADGFIALPGGSGDDRGVL